MPEIPLVMPKMSMTMTEGIFVAWHKQPGDEVRSGDVVAEVTTDKVDMEVESPIDGVLARLVAEPEDVIPVGEPIGFLTSDSDDLLGDLLGGDAPEQEAAEPEAADAQAEEGAGAVPAAPRAEPTAEEGVDTPPTTQAEPPAEPGGGTEPAEGAAPAPPSDGPAKGASAASGGASSSSAPDPSTNGWVPSVPLARVRAGELGVDLASVEGTGPGGVVRVLDVERAAPSSAPPRRPGTGAAAVAAVRPGGGDAAVVRRRAALARRMTESAAVPQFVVFRDLDLDDLAAARDGISWTAVLLAAYAAVLREDPVLHARWAGERRQSHDEVVVSVAVDTPDGLLAPSLAAPDRLPLREVDAALRALAARAREGRLSVADLTPGTTTVSNLGGFGVDAFTALLTPPQATALSLGAVAPVPVAVPGGLGVRVACRAGLAVDHRVADGADAARFLQRLQDRLADPPSLGL